jgi:hypothetical protein
MGIRRKQNPAGSPTGATGSQDTPAPNFTSGEAEASTTKTAGSPTGATGSKAKTPGVAPKGDKGDKVFEGNQKIESEDVWHTYHIQS